MNNVANNISVKGLEICEMHYMFVRQLLIIATVETYDIYQFD